MKIFLLSLCLVLCLDLGLTCTPALTSDSLPQTKELQCYLEIRPTKTVITTVTRTTTALITPSNVTKMDTCIANLMQFTTTVLPQRPRPTSTPRHRKRSKKRSNRRRRKGPHPFTTVTAQSPKPTSMPSPSQAQGNRNRPSKRRNGNFGPPRPIEPGEIFPTTTATPQSISTPRPRKRSNKRKTSTAVPGPPRPTESGQPIVTTTQTLQPTSTPRKSRASKMNRRHSNKSRKDIDFNKFPPCPISPVPGEPMITCAPRPTPVSKKKRSHGNKRGHG